MDNIAQRLKAYIEAHPFDSGDSDCETVLDQLYQAYQESHESDPSDIRDGFRELDNLLGHLPLEDNKSFLEQYPMICINDTFFTVNGRVTDENRLRKQILDWIKPYVTVGIPKKINNLLDTMRVISYSEPLPAYTDRIHLANGTYFLSGEFDPVKDFCINRLPVAYNPGAATPTKWLAFLNQLAIFEEKEDAA